jgi:hypothetical protein
MAGARSAAARPHLAAEAGGPAHSPAITRAGRHEASLGRLAGRPRLQSERHEAGETEVRDPPPLLTPGPPLTADDLALAGQSSVRPWAETPSPSHGMRVASLEICEQPGGWSPWRGVFRGSLPETEEVSPRNRNGPAPLPTAPKAAHGKDVLRRAQLVGRRGPGVFRGSLPETARDAQKLRETAPVAMIASFGGRVKLTARFHQNSRSCGGDRLAQKSPLQSMSCHGAAEPAASSTRPAATQYSHGL